MRSVPRVALVAVAMMASLGAQAPVPTQFDVASIKPATSGDTRRMIGPEAGGRFRAVNVGLRQLIAFAFGVANSRADLTVVGGPAWIDSARFDVDAVVPGGSLPPGTAVPLVLKLLEERFQLRAHRATMQRPVYHLVVDRGDGRLGEALRPTTTNCGVRNLPPLCGLRIAPGDVSGDGVTAAQLATELAPFAGRVIVDRTGLSQLFDVDLKWIIDSPGGDAVGGTNLPGLFTALKEQLGLRLDDAVGFVQVVVVDSVAMLSPN